VGAGPDRRRLPVSATLAALCYALAPTPGLAGRVLMESAWVTTFSRLPQRLREEQPGTLRDGRIITQLQVQLTDGSEYLGMRDAYSAETAMSDRELVLAQPLQSKPVDGPFAPMDQGWQRIIIPASQIRSIAVRFAAAPQGGQPGPVERGTWLTKTAYTWTTSPARLAAVLAAELVLPVAIGTAIRLA